MPKRDLEPGSKPTSGWKQGLIGGLGLLGAVLLGAGVGVQVGVDRYSHEAAAGQAAEPVPAAADAAPGEGLAKGFFVAGGAAEALAAAVMLSILAGRREEELPPRSGPVQAI